MTSRRVLSISHSYVVALNRALPNALARLGWDVTVVAPPFFQGDLRPITLETSAMETARLRPVTLRVARHPRLMTWSRDLQRVLDDDWTIVHAWEEPYIPAGAQVARGLRNGRLVFATFQNISKRYPPPFNWLEQYSLARAHGWIAFGVTVERALAARDAYARLPHRVIGPGLDLDRFAPDVQSRAAARDELDFSPNDCVIGFAGRFVPEKGLATLTAALDRTRGVWKALFLGGGPLLRDLEDWATRHPGRVRIITDATHARMPRYLGALDVLAVPSRTTTRWREQFGRVIVEAMACGVAVVGSDSGEIPFVIDGSGVVLPEADVDAWARTIDGLIAAPEQRADWSRLALARARAFSAEVSAAAHAEFFEQLIAH